MTKLSLRLLRLFLLLTASWATTFPGVVAAQTLASLFPCGGRAGTSLRVTLSSNAEKVICAHRGITFERSTASAGNTFRVRIAANVPTGVYDVQALTSSGLSAPRLFFVSNRPQVRESADNDSAATAQPVPLGHVVAGRVEQAGDVDYYRFSAKRGQRVIVECWADRLDSKLRAVLKVSNQKGQLLGVSRGYFGVDPVVVCDIPADGEYVIQLTDLVFNGGKDYGYRLDVENGPRMVFAVPALVPRDRSARITVFGWNLRSSTNDLPRSAFESQEVEVPAAGSRSELPPVHRSPAQVAVDARVFRFSGADAPLLLGETDLPINVEQPTVGRTATDAQALAIPASVTGQLIEAGESDWYSFQAKSGEVLHFQILSHRIGAPADISLQLYDENGRKELTGFHDERRNIGGKRFPSNHVDPEGHWVVPKTGRYAIVVRDVVGGARRNPRRVYALQIRRQVPDMQLVVLPQPVSPLAINVAAGGRQLVDILAFRRRSLNSSIQVLPVRLPPGVVAEPIWLGPGVTKAPLVISADADAADFVGEIQFKGVVADRGLRLERRVFGATMVRADLPNGQGRLASRTTLAVAGKSTLRLTANCARQRLQQGSIIDINTEISRPGGDEPAEVRLRAVGLPDRIRNRLGIVDRDRGKGVLSLYLPPDLPPGNYSFVVQGNTTTKIKNKQTSVTLYSNPVSVEVYPAPFVLQVALEAPRTVRRGQYVRVNYTAHRKDGFIGKIHTELRAAGPVTGLRGRGVTFVGQTESGTLQIIASDNATLGRQASLRLEAVGTVEDEPVFVGSCFLHLEIVE